MRAIWRRTLRSSLELSSWPVACRKRRFSAACLVSRSSCTSDGRSRSCSSWFFLAIVDSSDAFVAGDDPRLDRQLLHCLLHGLTSLLRVREGQLEEDPAGLHHGDP